MAFTAVAFAAGFLAAGDFAVAAFTVTGFAVRATDLTAALGEALALALVAADAFGADFALTVVAFALTLVPFALTLVPFALTVVAFALVGEALTALTEAVLLAFTFATLVAILNPFKTENTRAKAQRWE
ncbi:hypothetical protein [Rubripirellula tenax]|uniref:hypothetical protein n=1 Tax=Rubripirellula tenax TaxID=2528015 RepID=UPI0011B47D90|nr:hypothetical protein [Rubripirellula tenax]